MNTLSIRRALRSLLPGSAAARPEVVLQPVGFEASQRDTLPAVLDVVGRELGLALSLDDARGDAVLAEQDFVSHVSPQVLSAFLDERPLLAVSMPPVDAARRALQEAHADLARQLRLLRDNSGLTPLAALSTLPPSSGFDSQFDSRAQAEQFAEIELDADRAQLLNTLRRGLVDPTEPLLVAGYGPKAALVIDFATGIATLDERADQHLRVTREVPYLAHGAQPGMTAKARELDQVVWDIALAAGGYRLLNSPDSWWQALLIAQPRLDVARFSSRPQHREMARCLAVAPISPAELRRRCRVGLTDLRGFLQACLFLGLVYWVPPART